MGRAGERYGGTKETGTSRCSLFDFTRHVCITFVVVVFFVTCVLVYFCM